MNVWILVVLHDFQAVGNPFQVNIEPSGTVDDIKEEVQQKFSDLLGPNLVVLKTKMILKAFEEWEEILKNINVNDRNTIKVLCESDMVANLGLSDGQILLVQIISESRPSTSRAESEHNATDLPPLDHIEQLLTPLRESIIHKPPFASGSLHLPTSHFSLFYKITKDDHAARHINFVNATLNELEQLAQACEPATFGHNKEDVMDETYRKAGKLDTDYFSTPLLPDYTDLIKIVRNYLLEGTDSARKIKVELYKLNVYSKGSFFKPHVDTPRNKKMFGSLVVVFPTPHEGGALLLRHRGQEWRFDSAAVLSVAPPSSIAYAVFFSDIEHEVLPVTSGHRVTLTYNLYFDDNERPSANDLVSGLPSAPQEENEQMFRSAFKALLNNPAFLPDGGTLGFGLRHAYQVDSTLEHVYSLLKGSDGAVYQSLRALGFEPVLYMYYYYEQWDDDIEAVLTDRVADLGDDSVEDPISALRGYGGICVQRDGQEVNWVTPVTTFNRRECPFVTYGNEATLNMMYGDVCLLVRIGMVGERLAYLTAAQASKEAKEENRDY